MNAAYGILTPAYYRLEVQQMVEVTYPDGNTSIEPDVDQRRLACMPEEILVGTRFWSVYGRRTDGTVDHIADLTDFTAACQLCEDLGGHSDLVPPGPSTECHGVVIQFLHDGYWPDTQEDRLNAVNELLRRTDLRARDTLGKIIS